jgi:hypothetical protein
MFSVELRRLTRTGLRASLKETGREFDVMDSGSAPRWQWIVVGLLIVCVIGYIWTLQ